MSPGAGGSREELEKIRDARGLGTTISGEDIAELTPKVMDVVTVLAVFVWTGMQGALLQRFLVFEGFTTKVPKRILGCCRCKLLGGPVTEE